MHDNHLGTTGRDALVSSCRGICIGEFHRPEIAEGHIYIVLSVVFDDPLGILQTKWGAFRLEHLLYLLICGQVLDLGYTTIGRSRGDCETDLVTSLYGKAVEETRFLWKPIIPS